MQIASMDPSNLRNVLGACDPASVVDHNIGLINTHLSLTIPLTAAADGSSIAAVLQTTFDSIAEALGVTFWPVATSRDPEVATQTNFEMINDLW